MTGRPTRLIPDPNATSRGATLVASRVISTSPIKLLAIIVTNTNSAGQYIQVHESATLPSDNAVPALPSIFVGDGPASTMFQFGDSGVDLDQCTICNSSAPEKKTIGAADCQIVAVVAG